MALKSKNVSLDSLDFLCKNAAKNDDSICVVLKKWGMLGLHTKQH